ncbi:hypothetical protein LSTR_LSTR011836 [Laodelphax striatellus]|uniref:Uncharacterized protein n=1 Tax=Laodelphax striatellus TaxID=195883 RepID=A0A482X4Y8_LAOST|nr:hypothetical protein LSTR_LSTR011836 [Laodelphax striatellus]
MSEGEIIHSVPGFCPICGSASPPLGLSGNVTCPRCKNDLDHSIPRVKSEVMDPANDSSDCDEGPVDIKEEIDIDDSHYSSLIREARADIKQEQLPSNPDDDSLADEEEKDRNDGIGQQTECKDKFPNPYVKLYRFDIHNRDVDLYQHRQDDDTVCRADVVLCFLQQLERVAITWRIVISLKKKKKKKK